MGKLKTHPKPSWDTKNVPRNTPLTIEIRAPRALFEGLAAMMPICRVQFFQKRHNIFLNLGMWLVHIVLHHLCKFPRQGVPITIKVSTVYLSTLIGDNLEQGVPLHHIFGLNPFLVDFSELSKRILKSLGFDLKVFCSLAILYMIIIVTNENGPEARETYSRPKRAELFLYSSRSKTMKGANIVPKQAYIGTRSCQFGTQW